MSGIIEVTDLSDPALEVYARLTEAQLRNRLEPEKGIFIAESVKVIRLALEAGCAPVSLLMEERQLSGQGGALRALCGDVPVYVGRREVLASLTGYALTRGVLCAMRRPAAKTAEEVCRNARRIAVLEDITDTVNLGAIFRSAAALGVDGVLLSPGCADPLLRRAVRVSMGTVFLVPWARLGEAADWPVRALGRLKALGFTAAAMALGRDSLPIDELRPGPADRLAILLGTEGEGLRPETVDACDARIVVPMARGVDSLNVAAAAAVAFWELRVKSMQASI